MPSPSSGDNGPRLPAFLLVCSTCFCCTLMAIEAVEIRSSGAAMAARIRIGCLHYSIGLSLRTVLDCSDDRGQYRPPSTAGDRLANNSPYAQVSSLRCGCYGWYQ